MTIEVIQRRLEIYEAKTKQDELNALKEICQELVLAALARIDFFKVAAFQGGTALRIAHGMPRFSEDLGFILIDKTGKFSWDASLHALQVELHAFSLKLQVQDRTKADNVIKKAFLKENSFGKVLKMSPERTVADPQTIQIKLEVDTRPPEGSEFESHFLEFPYPFSYVTQDLPSLFAGKCHALLRRKYLKGRDWYDFIWYVTHRTPINFSFLQNALHQTNSAEETEQSLTKEKFIERMHAKVDSIAWEEARSDVLNFVRGDERRGLEIWSAPFFHHLVTVLSKYLV